jgi:hypothetical protein
LALHDQLKTTTPISSIRRGPPSRFDFSLSSSCAGFARLILPSIHRFERSKLNFKLLILSIDSLLQKGLFNLRRIDSLFNSDNGAPYLDESVLKLVLSYIQGVYELAARGDR